MRNFIVLDKLLFLIIQNEGNNFIDKFLTTAFASISNHENRNTRCEYDLKNALERLDAYNKDYFIVFAHVDQNSGIFNECNINRK